MAVFLAFCASVCFAFSTILTKKALLGVSAEAAALVRTAITCCFTAAVCYVRGGFDALGEMPQACLVPLLLSGACSGLSWLFSLKALSLGEVSRLQPIDNLGTALTMLLAFAILDEPVTAEKLGAIFCICIGTVLMIEIRSGIHQASAWLVYAFLSMASASASSILVKLALAGLNSSLVALVRNAVSLSIAAYAVWRRDGFHQKKFAISGELLLVVAGILVGGSSLCSFPSRRLHVDHCLSYICIENRVQGGCCIYFVMNCL